LSIGDVPQVLISTTDLQTRVEQWLRASPAVSSAPPVFSLTRERRNTASDYVAPQTQIEKSIVEVWQQLLGVELIGLHDNFFELGGDSLLATQAVSRIRQKVSVDVPLRSFLETSNVAALAEAIAQRQSQKERVTTVTISSGEVSPDLPGMLQGQSIDEVLRELDMLSEDDVSLLLERARQTPKGDSAK
jgi:acyl carrier protein